MRILPSFQHDAIVGSYPYSPEIVTSACDDCAMCSVYSACIVPIIMRRLLKLVATRLSVGVLAISAGTVLLAGCRSMNPAGERRSRAPEPRSFVETRIEQSSVASTNGRSVSDESLVRYVSQEVLPSPQDQQPMRLSSKPRTVADGDNFARWKLSLEEVNSIALANCRLLRSGSQYLSLNDPLLTNPEAVASIFDPVLQARPTRTLGNLG